MMMGPWLKVFVVSFIIMVQGFTGIMEHWFLSLLLISVHILHSRWYYRRALWEKYWGLTGMWLTACNGGYFCPPGNKSMKTLFFYILPNCLPSLSRKINLQEGDPRWKSSHLLTWQSVAVLENEPTLLFGNEDRL